MDRTVIILLLLLLSNQIFARSDQSSRADGSRGEGVTAVSSVRPAIEERAAAFSSLPGSRIQTPPSAQSMSADDGQSHIAIGSSCIPVRSDLREENLAYGAGEHFTFTVHYNWGIINSDVGVADIDLDTVRVNGLKSFYVKVYGRTWRWYDKIFSVREDFRSWFTVDGVVPLRFTRNTREGKYVATNTYNYIWTGEEPKIEADVYSSHSGRRSLSLPLDHCTFDLPALFYLARNMDFDSIVPERKYPMTFAIDDDVYNVYFIMKDRQELKIKGLGTVKTIRFAAKLLAGTVFTGEEDMMIWVTDDENRIPVYFEAPILVGTASGKLSGYSGLKHDFSSLVKKK